MTSNGLYLSLLVFFLLPLQILSFTLLKFLLNFSFHSFYSSAPEFLLCSFSCLSFWKNSLCSCIMFQILLICLCFVEHTDLRQVKTLTTSMITSEWGWSCCQACGWIHGWLRTVTGGYEWVWLLPDPQLEGTTFRAIAQHSWIHREQACFKGCRCTWLLPGAWVCLQQVPEWALEQAELTPRL